MTVATFNVKTVRTAEILLELEEGLEKMKWNVLGLSKIRQTEEKCPKSETDKYTTPFAQHNRKQQQEKMADRKMSSGAWK